MSQFLTPKQVLFIYAPHFISNNEVPVGTALFQTTAATKCTQPKEVVYKMASVVSRGEKKGVEE